jgi:O-Antigen ligase
MKSQRSYYYGQVVQGLEYNPRLFLYLLILAAMVVFAYQFASQVSSERVTEYWFWRGSVLTSLGLLAILAIWTWPFYGLMFYVGLSICMDQFVRGETMMSLGSALVYKGDLFIGAFMVLEFFRGCMRQTHLYTKTDRWMVALYVWTWVNLIRGLFSYGYSTFGEGREFLHLIAYFVTIHYVTRVEQTESVLKWLKWICVATSVVMWARFVQFGFEPRFGGGHPVHFYGDQMLVVLGVLLGRDHIKRALTPTAVGLVITILVVMGGLAVVSIFLNGYVLLLAAPVVLAIPFLMQHRVLATAALMLIIALGLYDAVRSPILAMLSTFPFLLWIARRHFLKAVLLGLFALGAFFGLVLVMDPVFHNQLVPALEKGFSGLINPSEDPTGYWRLYSYRWEMNKIFSNPFWVIIGQGWGGYYEWYFGLTDEIIRTAPHDQYIVIWSKMGLVGLVLYCGAIFSFYRQTFRFLKENRNELYRSIIMILMVVTFANQVHAIATSITVAMWVQMGLGTALCRLWSIEDQGPPIIRATTTKRHDFLREPARFSPHPSPQLSRRQQS